MSTGSASVMLAAVLVTMLAGCAAGRGQAILSAAELDAMIRVEVETLEPAQAGEHVVAARQP